MQTTMDPVNLCARENIIGDFRVVVFFFNVSNSRMCKGTVPKYFEDDDF